MTSAGRALLYLEVVVCFGAVTAILAAGILLLPLWLVSEGVKLLAWLGLMSVLDSGPGWVGPVSIATVIAGALGLIGVARLVQLVTKPGEVLQRPLHTVGLIVAGVLGLCSYNFVVESTDPRTDAVELAVFFLLPLVGTLHLLFLARAAFSPRVRQRLS